MPKRALIAIATFGLAATACVSVTTPAVDYGTGTRFVPFVVDSLDDVGRGDAVSLTTDGIPYVSYFGFAAKLSKGEIAIPRPFGAPTVPGVMLSTSSTNGLWQRGAVDMNAPPSATDSTNVAAVPFGPVKTDNLDLTSRNTNGTAVVVDDAGTVHMAWTAGNSVEYATTKLGGTASVDSIFALKGSLDQAGPLGRPSLALDDSGNAWVAFGVETAAGVEIHVASQANGKWSDQVAASVASCNGCPAPQPTGIGVVGGSAMVVYADPSAQEVLAATFDGKTWNAQPVATHVSGFGLSFATNGDSAYAAYFSGSGSVEELTWTKGTWTRTKVADATDPDATATGDAAPNTSVAATDDGTVYVAWEDNGVQVSSGTDSFSAVETNSILSNGADPALATSGAGVALGWYDTTAQNQMIGSFGDLTDVVIARPSPSLTVSQAPAGGATCGGKAVSLDISATTVAFDTDCLVGPADEKFTITFDNQDAANQHNIDVLDKQGGKSFGSTTAAPGPTKETLPLSLPAGTYYFQCDVHPTQMFGTLAVVKGAK